MFRAQRRRSRLAAAAVPSLVAALALPAVSTAFVVDSLTGGAECRSAAGPRNQTDHATSTADERHWAGEVECATSDSAASSASTATELYKLRSFGQFSLLYTRASATGQETRALQEAQTSASADVSLSFAFEARGQLDIEIDGWLTIDGGPGQLCSLELVDADTTLGVYAGDLDAAGSARLISSQTLGPGRYTVDVVCSAAQTGVPSTGTRNASAAFDVSVTFFAECTIMGTDGDDVLEGTDGADIICGRSGNDTIHGNAGDDIIYGQGGDDTLSGGPGSDQLFGGTGVDEISGDDDDDELSGGSDGDYICGGDGRDLVSGGAGDDVIGGGAGADVIAGGRGADVMHGFDFTLPGEFTCVSAGVDDADVVRGRDGDDHLFGDGGNDGLYGGRGADIVEGGDGNDVLVGHADADVLKGDGGNDLFLARDDEDDSVQGGDGTGDRAVVDEVDEVTGVEVDLP